jgi:dsRNA-specific ribonuclease
MEDFINPYNEKNIEIKIENIKEILEKYHVFYEIHDIEIWKRAFVNSSYTKNKDIKYNEKPSNCLDLKSKSNERLEFIGDGILELITKYYLYKRFPNSDEGFMTEKKICLVKNDHIGKLCYKLGLHKWLLISKNAEEKKNRTNYKKLGCLFEAFLGALFLDSNKIEIKDMNIPENYFLMGYGIQYCQIFIENIYNNLVDWEEILENDDNYKNIFQVKIQKEFKCTPEYKIINQDEELRYTMGVYLCIHTTLDIKKAINYEKIGSFEAIKKMSNPIIFFGSGVHKIKKKAEQLACLEAIKKIECNI